VVVTGVDREPGGVRKLYYDDQARVVENINPYLTEHDVLCVPARKKPMFTSVTMDYGVYYSKSAGLILDADQKAAMQASGIPASFTRRFLGSTEYINGKERFCLWIADDELDEAFKFDVVKARVESVRSDRLATTDQAVNKLAAKPHQFRERKGDEDSKIFIPIVSSENRAYFPVGLADKNVIPTNKAFYISTGPSWVVAILSSKLHLAWIATVCGRLEMRYSYSNTLGWNTFPVPTLTEQNKADLTRCAEEILLAREAHFPATIAELYDPAKMPVDLRAAHDRNDETLERIYIGRRFKNDTERLEKLFEMYTKMTRGGKG
jgi:hypothetical protein